MADVQAPSTDTIATFPTKKKRGRPRKYPVEHEKGRTKKHLLDEPLVQALPDNGWADHSDVSRVTIETEVLFAMEHMWGMARGLVRETFLENARQTLKRHYPKLRKSAGHLIAAQNGKASTPALVSIPIPCAHRIRTIIRLCDLLDTMVYDGVIA